MRSPCEHDGSNDAVLGNMEQQQEQQHRPCSAPAILNGVLGASPSTTPESATCVEEFIENQRQCSAAGGAAFNPRVPVSRTALRFSSDQRSLIQRPTLAALTALSGAARPPAPARAGPVGQPGRQRAEHSGDPDDSEQRTAEGASDDAQATTSVDLVDMTAEELHSEALRRHQQVALPADDACPKAALLGNSDSYCESSTAKPSLFQKLSWSSRAEEKLNRVAESLLSAGRALPSSNTVSADRQRRLRLREGAARRIQRGTRRFLAASRGVRLIGALHLLRSERSAPRWPLLVAEASQSYEHGSAMVGSGACRRTVLSIDYFCELVLDYEYSLLVENLAVALVRAAKHQQNQFHDPDRWFTGRTGHAELGTASLPKRVVADSDHQGDRQNRDMASVPCRRSVLTTEELTALHEATQERISEELQEFSGPAVNTSGPLHEEAAADAFRKLSSLLGEAGVRIFVSHCASGRVAEASAPSFLDPVVRALATLASTPAAANAARPHGGSALGMLPSNCIVAGAAPRTATPTWSCKSSTAPSSSSAGSSLPPCAVDRATPHELPPTTAWAHLPGLTMSELRKERLALASESSTKCWTARFEPTTSVPRPRRDGGDASDHTGYGIAPMDRPDVGTQGVATILDEVVDGLRPMPPSTEAQKALAAATSAAAATSVGPSADGAVPPEEILTRLWKRVGDPELVREARRSKRNARRRVQGAEASSSSSSDEADAEGNELVHEADGAILGHEAPLFNSATLRASREQRAHDALRRCESVVAASTAEKPHGLSMSGSNSRAQPHRAAGSAGHHPVVHRDFSALDWGFDESGVAFQQAAQLLSGRLPGARVNGEATTLAASEDVRSMVIRVGGGRGPAATLSHAPPAFCCVVCEIDAVDVRQCACGNWVHRECAFNYDEDKATSKSLVVLCCSICGSV